MAARIPANAPQAVGRVDLRIIARRGEERDRLLAAAETELDGIVDECIRAERAGGRVNVSLVARLGGVHRHTLAERLKAARSTTTTGRTPR